MLDRVIGVLAPHQCVVCGIEGSILCAWCAPEVIETIPSRCYHCKQMTSLFRVCSTCRKRSSLKHVWVCGVYRNAAQQLIHDLKFSRKRVVAKVVAEILDDTIPALPAETIITYIPTATSRIRIRGYDQSRLIARELAKRRKITCTPLFVRIGQARQVGSSKQKRLEQASNNLRPRTNMSTYGKDVLIIDDILTTGATLEAAAKLLKQSGVNEINAAVFAQKQ